MKKYALMIIMIGLLLMGSGMIFPGMFVDADTVPKTITTSRNHVLLDVDVSVDLSTYTVTREAGNFLLSDAVITSSSPEVVIVDDLLHVTAKGVFNATVTYDSFQMTLVLISKLASEDEYVIYSEDFSNMSGALPAQFSMLDGLGEPGGSAAIVGNRLFLSGNTIVLFPTYLQGFTNYVIEADVNMTRADNASRWTSLLFRYTKENYFQMAVRQTATAANGVEFAKRISGSWNVPATTSYSEPLGLAKTYRFKVDVFDTTVEQYINDQLLITYDSAYEFTYGRIGVQTNGSDVYFDNIKITLPADYVVEPGYEYKQVVDVYQPTTGIINPATTVVWIDNAQEVDDITQAVRPATAILRVNETYDITDAQGTILMSLEEALIKLDGKVIPAFYTEDTLIAAGLAETLRQLRIFDVFIVSSEADVILAAREQHNLMRGVLYYETLDSDQHTIDDLMVIRRAVNRAQAVAVLLPVDQLSKDDVFQMQKRAMTVWVTATDHIASQYKAVLSGANGIVTPDYEAIFDIYETFGENTHVRRPLMIAHRGLYNGAGGSSAPENTIESALASYEKGADILELDVHFSLDLEVVVIHDSTTIRTAPDYPNLTVSQSTLEQLKALTLVDPVGGRDDIKIPTLREYMEAFKGKDVVLFIEVKPTQPLLMEFVADIIEDLEMFDQSAIITFSASNISTMNEIYPDISNGLLTGGLLNAQSVNGSLTNMFSNIVTINATLNHNFGALRPEFINALIHRGVTVWPWTLNDFATLSQYYNYGVNGITTDFMTYFDDTFNRLTFDQYRFQYIFDESDMISLRGRIETQTGTTYPYMPEIEVIDEGGTGITFDQNGMMLTVENPGTFYGFTTFASNLPNGTPIRIVSDVFEIHAGYPVVETPEPTLPVDPAEPVEPSDTMLIVLVSIASASGLGLAGFFGYRWFKLRKVL
jgi:glycerophosphoryl diester phosphodiesterase